MGKDAHGSSGLPLSLKVKNTFIDINSSFTGEDPDGDEASFNGNFRQRQVSEPVPAIHRQISGASPLRNSDLRSMPLAADNFLLEEEAEEGEGEEENEEPETETEPAWVIGRQETFGRQQTEPMWPMATSQHLAQGNEQFWDSVVTAALANNGTGASAAPMAAADDGAEGAEPMLVQPGANLLPAGLMLLQMHQMQQMQVQQMNNMPSMLQGPVNPMLLGASAAMQTGPAPMLGLRGTAAAAGKAPCLGPSGGSAGPCVAGATASMAGLEAACGAAIPPPEWAEVSTIMMRNLPNKYTQHMLQEELHETGLMGTFDFLYLPIDPETNANRGYAFINFIDPGFAWMLKMAYEGRKMKNFNSDKVVSVAPAALQGFEANYAHYSSARVSRGDPAARPLFLRESRMQNGLCKREGRRRGGRRNTSSLIDMVVRQQHQVKVSATAAVLQQQQLQQQQAISALTKASAAAMASSLPPSNARSNVGVGSSNPGNVEANIPKFCPYCGGRAQPQFRFCQFCGSALCKN